MTSISALIFDFDGVLADTERLHLRAFQEAFAPRGWTLTEAAYFDRFLGYDDAGVVTAYARERAIALDPREHRALVAAKVAAFAQYLESGDILFHGAQARIVELAARYPLGIASGALHAEIAAILRAADLLRFFPVIVAADDVQTTKPSPEPYLTAATRLGVAPSACVAIEDSPPGLAAARAAGMRTIAVTTTVERGALADADAIVDTIAGVTMETLAQVERAQRL
jgi:beta-phosphoglucomutase